MSYTRETWVELASTDPASTPITAVRLNNIEAGIENSHGRSLATSDRDLLVSSDGNLFTGRVIFNNTLGLAEWYDGSTWASGTAGGESPADVTKSTSVEGTSRKISRADHKHDVATTTPVSFGSTANEGAGTPLARSAHVHAHPASEHQPGGSLAMAVDAAAGTGSLRTIGTTGALQAAAGTHTHIEDPAQATQAALEAETDEDTYAPPDLIKHSPGVAKVWVMWEQIGAHGITASYNMTSVTDGGSAGNTDHLWNTDFSTANYVVAFGSQLQSLLPVDTHVFEATQLAGSITSLTVIAASAIATDAGENYLAAFGDQ